MKTAALSVAAALALTACGAEPASRKEQVERDMSNNDYVAERISEVRKTLADGREITCLVLYSPKGVTVGMDCIEEGK